MTATEDNRPSLGPTPPHAGAAEALHWAKTPRPPSLAERLDEAAGAIHGVTFARITLAVLGALAAAAILPWTTCVAWVASGLLIEVWS